MTSVDMIDMFSKINLKAVAGEAISNTSDAYLDYNRDQMMRGKGRTKNIGRYRSAQYARFKFDKNSLAGIGNVDLSLTGSFQEKMTLEISGDDVNVNSTDSKTSDLVGKYGEQVFGLNPGSKEEYINSDLRPEFESIIEKITRLKFN